MTTEDKRLVIVRAVRDQHLTPTQAAARYRVSRQWVYKLLKRYDREGPAGLAPRSRAPRHRPGTTPAVITDRIIALRRQLTAEDKDARPETIGWHRQPANPRKSNESRHRV